MVAAKPELVDGCVHCHSRFRNRSRGLCSSCYDKIDIRLQYPLLSTQFVRSPIGEEYADSGRLPKPTTARPGSAAKVRVLIERAANGQSLWHPLDAGMDLFLAKRGDACLM